MLNSEWDGAIRDALAGAGQATLFVERREDLAATAASGEDPGVRQTLWGGACLDRPGQPLVFHSDLRPNRLGALVSGDPPIDSIEAPTESLAIDPGPALAAVAGTVVEARRRLPEAHFRTRWVEFDQSVLIGRGGDVLADRRRTCRIRMDGVLGRRGRSASASLEAVVKQRRNYNSSYLLGICDRLEARLDAADPPPGPATVVFAPAVAGIWIHELVGHAAEADVVARGASWWGRGIEPLRGDLTVIDDPRRGRAAWAVDDEGSPARPVALIREGRPKELLHSRRSASESDAKTTGHGRRGSYREAVLPRMGCTFIANGPDDPEEILKNVHEGIYVRRMESAHTDPATGRTVFRVTDADRIHAGRIERPLKQHLLETVAGKALAAIEGIGNDLAFDRCIGTCHRGGQPLSTSVGAPTICTRLMTVRF